MRDLWFIFNARKRGPELFEQGALVTSKSRGAKTSAGRGLGEEGRKQHHRDRYSYEDGKRRVEKRRGIIGHDIVDVRREGEVHGRQEAERADLRLRHDETATQYQRRKRYGHRRKVDGERHQVELGRENRNRRDEHGRCGGHADLVRLFQRGEQAAHDRGDDDRGGAARPGRREPNCGGDPYRQRGADPDQKRGHRVRPRPKPDILLRRFLAPVEGFDARPKLRTRKPQVTLILCTYQSRYDRTVSSGGLVRMGDPDAERWDFL